MKSLGEYITGFHVTASSLWNAHLEVLNDKKWVIASEFIPAANQDLFA